MTTAYQRIQAICQRDGKSQAITYVAYSRYQEHLENTITDRQDAGVSLTPGDEEQIRETLLTEQSVASHIRLAEEVLREETEKATESIRRRETLGTFGMAILTNIAGNLIYALLLILLFIIARDQIASWLSSLAQA